MTVWFVKAARQLPWREDTSPYRIWISEVMLQQTTVQTVRPFFERFIKLFPTLQSLAQSSEEDVLAAWSRLGYYTRARNLLKTARLLVNNGAELPEDLRDLQRLPGIGAYTAGAIRAIAFNRPSPMVDANARRLLGRILGIVAHAPRAEQQVWQASLDVSTAGTPRIVNQAMMEIGALVCTAGQPNCAECPLESLCKASTLRSFDWYGSVPKKQVIQRRQEVCVVARWADRWLLSRPSDGRWRGMWEFPRTLAIPDPEEAIRRLLNDCGWADVEDFEYAGAVRHQVTRYAISLHVLKCHLPSAPTGVPGEWRLASVEELAILPLPSPMRKIAELHTDPAGDHTP
ncbi:MAG: A/G-specific adenine glycosylase [Armatimonadetes bacterium]|nr:A/G-specific adenine glycosylase [Armatimonadota bacterium]